MLLGQNMKGSATEMYSSILGTPSPFCRRFEFALQQGVESSNTFLSASDTLLQEPNTKLSFPPGSTRNGSTQ